MLRLMLLVGLVCCACKVATGPTDSQRCPDGTELWVQMSYGVVVDSLCLEPDWWESLFVNDSIGP